MTVNPYFRSGLTVSVLGLLAACGGGGGGGGGSQTTTLQLDPANYGETPASIRTMADLDAVSVMYQDVSEIQGFVETVGLALDSAAATAAVTTTATAELCSVENGNLQVTDEVSVTGEHVEYRFDNCVVPNYTPQLLLDGFAVMDVQVSADGSKVVMTESYDISGTMGTGVDEMPIAIAGNQTMTGVFVNDTDFTVEISTPALEYLYGDQYTALRNSRISMALKGDIVTVTMNSQLIGSAMNGYLTITTPTPITANMYTASCPTSGHMKVEGDGVIDVRYGSNTGTGTGTEVLLNGSQVEYYPDCPVDVPMLGGTTTVLDATSSTGKTVALPAGSN